jgi:hypothetical protein
MGECVGAEEKSRNEILSRIVAGLSVKSQGGEELSSKIYRLSDEIKKVIESEDTIFGKFRVLVESFREIIPDEKQRFHAAIKALSTTSKLSQQEIVKAVNGQLAELKVLEKGLMSALPGWRDELKVMEAKSREMKDEMSKLREKIARLESEEKGIVGSMAAREKEMELVEKAVGKLFTDMGAEILSIKKKVEEFTAENAPSQPIWPGDTVKSDSPGAGKRGNERTSDIPEPSAPKDTEYQKRCPMCGGRMDFLGREKMWRCYSCAYEEAKKEPGGNEQKSEILETPATKDTEWQKQCPMCGGRMNFHSQEETWLCYTCAYEEVKKGEPKPAPASAPFAVPLADMSTGDYRESKKGSSLSNKQPPSKKKPCPVCRKKMNWYQKEGAWRCPFCAYERRLE